MLWCVEEGGGEGEEGGREERRLRAAGNTALHSSWLGSEGGEGGGREGETHLCGIKVM